MGLLSIFEGLEKFGLDHLKEMKLETSKDSQAEALKKKQINIKDYIFEKTFDCPVCYKQFKANVVRSSKLKLDKIDEDLCPTYVNIEPLCYEAIVCINCGYSGLKQNFSSITERQGEFILSTITPRFKPVIYPDEITIDMAIERFKLVLVNSLVKRAKDSEKGYICLKISWLYKMKQDKKNELIFTKEAYNALMAALTSEVPPLFGLDENTVLYLLAISCYKLSNYDEALRLLPKIILSKSISPRLKDRAIDLKDKIMAEKSAKKS